MKWIKTNSFNVVRNLVCVTSIAISSSSLIAEAGQSNCNQIETACGDAGFTRNLPEGRDLKTKCFEPIMQGQFIDGVKIDQSLVKKCGDELSRKPGMERRVRRVG